ncbi:hypothetical protein [Pontibacter beigongshangensis]|uniref:hypothetical protein n=1 Tax=Pontibacter beigongshangensis TaxID=2574733 RepID=UPI001650B1C9|nr:hypothetical protein [Pontibacter beigongshangensis]
MRFIYMVSALALFITAGCNNQPEQAEVVEKEVVVEKETVREVQVEAKAPATKVTVEKEKGTSLEINREGGSLKTKDVDIKINN